MCYGSLKLQHNILATVEDGLHVVNVCDFREVQKLANLPNFAPTTKVYTNKAPGLFAVSMNYVAMGIYLQLECYSTR